MDNFTWYAPIVKIDEETRTVSGWATTEEIDKQNEVVDYLGSKDAFSNWQGNIREMHEPKAVGKAVEVIPNDDQKRVWVSAYISKGADDTRQKVKEGILTGFSIGGQTMHKTAQVVKDMGTGGSRTVTRITKYRLNELSLVDNPANPGCSFTLVKSVDGIPYQTEIVEDSKKLVVTEAEDPLQTEVHSHRDKADSLTKKVLDRDELDKLTDSSFGVIRKYRKDDTYITERLLPMSDKVHAVTALAIMEKYNLTPDEIEAVHKKAQAILGSAYQTHNVTNRGGENEMDVTKLTEVIETLTKKVEALEKAFEGAYRPVPGAKESPKEPSATPALGESSAENSADAVSAAKKDENVQPPAPTGTELPATRNPVDPEASKDETKAAEVTVKAMAGCADGNITDAPEVKPSAVEESGDPAKVLPEVKTHEAAEVVKALPPELAAAIAAKEGKTTEDPKEEAVETPEEEAAEPVETEEEKKKRELAELEAKKLADSKSEKDLEKVTNELETLRKRFDAVTELLKKPMPRKRIIEKNTDTPTNDDSKFQSQREEVLTWVKSGKPLTAEQEKVREDVLNKSMDTKFGKAL